MKNKEIIGFTLGCFDMFHVGHINLFRNAKALCDKLIVGVCSDEYMIENKREPIYCQNERIEILKACKYCDTVVLENTLDKVELFKKYKFDILFVGSDWYDTKEYNKWEKDLIEYTKGNSKVIYLPYTQNVSSSLMIKKIQQK